MNLNNILRSAISDDLKKIAKKVYHKERITFDEGVLLFKEGELNFLEK